MITEDNIRAALDRVALRAPDPARVRARLAGRTQANAQRRALLVAGGAVAATAAVAGPAVLLYRQRYSQLPFLAPNVPVLPDERTIPNLGPATAEPPAGPGNRRLVLPYRPTWLPDGYVEASRLVGLDGAAFPMQRAWMRPADLLRSPAAQDSEPRPCVRLMLVDERHWAIENWHIPIKVNGVDGGLAPHPGSNPQVLWPVGGGLNLAVSLWGLGDDFTVAQRLARSVEPDEVTAVEMPLEFGWLPDLLQGWQTASIESTASSWVARLSVGTGGWYGAAGGITAELGPAVQPGPTGNASGGPATVRGREGLVYTYPFGGGWVYVELDDGLRLQVHGGTVDNPAPSPATVDTTHPQLAPPPIGISRDELLQVVEELKIGTAPYVDWIGTR